MTERIPKVVIFAGGEGTRLSEYTELRPKPLVEVGGVPLVVHVMRSFYRQGYREFILAVGYKSEMFKQYFRDYGFFGRNVIFTKYGLSVEDSNEAEDWTVRVIETGRNSTTGQRLHAVKEYLNGDDFFLTYGDTISNVNLSEVEKTLRSTDSLATITAVGRSERFGILSVDKDTKMIKSFSEKSNSTEELINGGFIACRNELLQEVDENSGDFSHDTLTRLSNEGKISYHHHRGFWQAVDTKRDVDSLSKILEENPGVLEAE